MFGFLGWIFTWWNGTTIGTSFHTWLRGEFVGEDEFGNRYYRDNRNDRRWVIYNGIADASHVSADWHGWLHHVVDTLPGDEHYTAKPWQKPHRPNMTGTVQAYRPSGSTLSTGQRPPATGDYTAWTPE